MRIWEPARIPRSRSGEVVLFVLLACVLSWSAYLVLRQLGVPLAPRMLMAMFGPMVAARLLTDRRLPAGLVLPEVAGRRLRATLWGAVAGTLIGLLLLGAGVLLSILAGDIGIRPGFHAVLARYGAQAPILVAFYALSVLGAYGEEYGWRGYLQTRLAGVGTLGAAAITAPIATFWHIPAVLYDGFDFPRHHILGIGMLLVMFLPFGIVQSWLRERTGGMAAPTASHAMLNIVAGGLALFTTRTAGIMTAPVGLLGFVPYALFAAWLVATGRVRLARRSRPEAVARGQLVPVPVAA
jgi:membrane protease YdiL (CAAX protease family)